MLVLSVFAGELTCVRVNVISLFPLQSLRGGGKRATALRAVAFGLPR